MIRCFAARFIGTDSMVPGVRARADAHGGLRPPAGLATNAIVHVLAETCGEALDAQLPSE